MNRKRIRNLTVPEALIFAASLFGILVFLNWLFIPPSWSYAGMIPFSFMVTAAVIQFYFTVKRILYNRKVTKLKQLHAQEIEKMRKELHPILMYPRTRRTPQTWDRDGYKYTPIVRPRQPGQLPLRLHRKALDTSYLSEHPLNLPEGSNGLQWPTDPEESTE